MRVSVSVCVCFMPDWLFNTESYEKTEINIQSFEILFKEVVAETTFVGDESRFEKSKFRFIYPTEKSFEVMAGVHPVSLKIGKKFFSTENFFFDFVQRFFQAKNLVDLPVHQLSITKLIINITRKNRFIQTLCFNTSLKLSWNIEMTIFTKRKSIGFLDALSEFQTR